MIWGLLVLSQFPKKMPMKMETLADLDAVGEGQNVALKKVAVN